MCATVCHCNTTLPVLSISINRSTTTPRKTGTTTPAATPAPAQPKRKRQPSTSANPSRKPHTPHTPHSPAIKALALATTQGGGTTDEAAAITGVPTNTIRGWVRQLEDMGASDVEKLVEEKTKVIRGLWALWGVELFHFAAELMAAGNAHGVLYIITAAGICSTKLAEAAGGDMRPRYGGAPPARVIVDGSSSSVSSDARERIRARLAAPADPLPSAPVSDDALPSTDAM